MNRVPNSEEYRICTKCIMDNRTDPGITFDEKGVCSNCRDYSVKMTAFPASPEEKKSKFDDIVSRIKEDGIGKEYDCVIGISGGIDSAYLSYVAKNAGLRILAVHVDAGWDTEVAVDNIKKLCTGLDIELHTVVVDWETMKELQRAYMFSGLINLDIPQDHAFMAGTYGFAKKYGIRYMLNGSNMATEGILPHNFGYSAVDLTNIKSVYKKCGRGRVALNKYPQMNLWDYIFMYLGRTKRVNLLNYVEYAQKTAVETLHREFGWNYYGGKHFESRFTKFYQSYFLPRKYGLEKKRAHVSSLIVGGELTREEGLRMMDDDSAYTEEMMLQDREYILKKLDITNEEWNEIMGMPPKRETDYRNNKALLERLVWIKKKIS